MSDSTPAAPPAAPAAGTGVSDEALAAGTAGWEAMLASYAKQPGSMGFPGAVPFSMPFGQPFMYPGLMLPGFMPGAFGAIGAGGEGGEGKTGEEGDGEDTEDEDDDEDDDEDGEEDETSDKEGSRPKRKRASRSAAKKAKPAAEGGMGVKSNSSAALAMLAGAAASKPPNPAAAAAAAAMQQNLGELWGSLNGGAAAAAMGPAASLPDMAKLTQEQQQMLQNAGFEGITDERELKRMRRKQSNRESARRSRLRKQAECEQLGRQVKELGAENARLREEKLQLLAQIEILNAKLSMSSAFGAVHALGAQGTDLEKMAEMRAKQNQDMQNMAAAMAQAMQVNGGAMLGSGLGLPALDATGKPLGAEGDDAVAAAAAAAAAAAGVAVPVVEGGGEPQDTVDA